MEYTVGLFGTCGSSTWRKRFIESFEENNIKFFNPQLDEGEWTPDRADEFVQNENWNLKNNELILFPITDETTGQGSLAEIGFSVADTLRNIKKTNNQMLIVYIDPKCNDPKASEAQIQDSERSRKLVLSKVIEESKINPNVFVVNSMTEMYKLTLNLCEIMKNNEGTNADSLKTG